MKSVVWVQFAKDRRNPWLLILLISAGIVGTLLFAGGIQAPITVAIFSEEEHADEIEKKWEKLLNTGDVFRFKIMEPEQAREEIREGTLDAAVSLMEMDYRLVTVKEQPSVAYIQQHVDKVFQREAKISALESAGNEKIRREINEYLAAAPFQIEMKGLDSEEIPGRNLRTQLLFAYTFLIAMFVLGFRVNAVTKDKVSGIWDRMILSPIQKTSMYCGYVLYSFLVTMFQITVILLLFKYVMDYEVGDNLLLVLLIAAVFTFSMISIALLITGFVRTPEQFYGIYPSIIPLIPIISGAYMEPGSIKNSVLLFVADLFPLVHAIEATMSVVFSGAGLQDVLMPLLIMVLIGVVAMGMGINLIERRSH